jgi:hypothetical protein
LRSYARSTPGSVLEASITTTEDKVLDIFRIQNLNGEQIPESDWKAIREAMQGLSLKPIDQEKIYIEGSERKSWESIHELNGKLLKMLETVVNQHEGEEVVMTSNTLMEGFKALGTAPEPRLHAELMRFIRYLLVYISENLRLTKHTVIICVSSRIARI